MNEVVEILKILGSLGIFIYGMYLMSEAIQKIAGPSLRKILSGMTSNRLSGVMTGFLTTSAIQSSSATTVMVVSFVNAGLLTLVQAIGVIMGANIGTTVTAWLISLLGFGNVKITVIAIVMIGLTFPLLFSKKARLKNFAEFILGFGILFIGLDFLKGSVPDIGSNPGILEFLTNFTELGYFSYIIFILVGAILTLIVQSSSATMAITLALLAQGWIQFDIAAAMVLGENIGTTVTANLASLVGNIHAKRAARFHTVFNLIGVIWMVLVFPFFLVFIDWLNEAVFGYGVSVLETVDVNSVSTDEIRTREFATTRGLSLFHSVFNIANTVVLFGFAPLLAKLVIRFSPAKDPDDEEHRLQYIGGEFNSPPELLIEQAKKEIGSFGKIIEKMCGNVIVLFFHKEPKKRNKLIKKIERREEFTDHLEIEIGKFLTKLTEQNMSPASSKHLKSMFRIINELESIADTLYRLTKHFENSQDNKKQFPEYVKNELEEYFNQIFEAIQVMHQNLEQDYSKIDLEAAYVSENAINKKMEDLEFEHFQRLGQGTYGVQEGIIYLEFVKGIEKIGDHIININEAVSGKKEDADDR